MTNRYTIDVVIPVYNGAPFIEAAIFSVLNQTYPVNNVFVIDDGSTDESGSIVRRLSRKYPSIHYCKRPHQGPSATRNVGINLCRGNFIALLDADDVWEKEKLKKQIETFRKSSYPNLGVVYCDYFLIDAVGKIIENLPTYRLNPKVRGKVYRHLLTGNKIAGSDSAVLIRRTCFDNIGLFNERLPSAEDWDLWLRISQKYQFDFVSEKLVGIRRHPNNLQKDSRVMLSGNVALMGSLVADNSLSPSVVKSFRYQLLRDIIAKLPNLDFIRIIQSSLPPKAYKTLFGNKIYLVKCITGILLDKMILLPLKNFLPLLKNTHD